MLYVILVHDINCQNYNDFGLKNKTYFWKTE